MPPIRPFPLKPWARPRAATTAATLWLVVSGPAFCHGTYHELVEALNGEISAQPDNPALYARRAFIHLEHRDWQACLIDIERAQRHHGAESSLSLLQARALAAGSKSGMALAVLDDLILLQPQHADALMERARIKSSTGRHEEAASDFCSAMPWIKHPEPDTVFEHVSMLQAADRSGEALAVLDAALSRTPGLPSLLDRAVALECELGRHADAARRVGVQIATAKVKEPLLARHASLLAMAGDNDASLKVWRELLSSIAAMPLNKRESHAMSLLAEQAIHAIAALTQTGNTASSNQ